MKKEIRVIGIDDSPFKKFKYGNTLVIGTIFRGGHFMDGVLSTKVKVDGSNATSKLIEMINSCKFKPQLQCILLDGIALGGFNVVDINKLSKNTKIPVIVVIRRKPDIVTIKKTLIRINKKNKIKLIDKAGQVCKIGKIYCQLVNISIERAKEILKITSTHSLIPEPIRVAHLIASGVAFGESKGRA